MTDKSTIQMQDRAPKLGEHASIEAALGQLGLGIAVMEGEKLTYANDALAELLGYDREDLLSNGLMELVNVRNRETIEQRHRARLAGEQVPVRYMVTIDHASGRPLDLDISTVLTPGDPPSVLIVARDITDDNRNDRKVRQSHKMEAIGQLATGIAHDFNNYLTALRLTSEALEEWVTAPEARELIDELSQLTIGAARLSRQLLAFGGRDVGQPTMLDVNVAIFETAAMLERIIGERVELVTRLHPGLPPVQADEGQLEQVIANLVMNARDALEEGGQVLVKTDLVDGEQTLVRIAVHDDGTGMSEEVQDRAFEPYFTTKANDHTGMGLAIVYGVVQQLDGKVNLESTPQKGTTVTVDLPAEHAPFDPPRIEENAQTVLLVEDEATLRQLLAAGLRRHGYQVTAVSDGDEAQRAVKKGIPIDVLVTDMVIPGASGESVVTAFRTSRPEAAVVVISGYSEKLDAERWASERIEFLRKPFSAGELVEAIERASSAQ